MAAKSTTTEAPFKKFHQLNEPLGAMARHRQAIRDANRHMHKRLDLYSEIWCLRQGRLIELYRGKS